VAKLVLESVGDVWRARDRLCYLDDGRAPETDADAAELVRQRGFLLLGATAQTGLPNLSAADPEREWSVSWRAWRWKEVLPGTGACAYLKWFRNQGTFIAWSMYPAFYAIWGPRGDAAHGYQSGVLTSHEHEVLELVAELGPVSSRDLWLRLRGRWGGQRNRMLAALVSLQRRFYITVSGGELDRWSMHYWDLVERAVPGDVLDGVPDPYTAQTDLIAQAVANLVLATPREVGSLFGWSGADVSAVAAELAAEGRLRLDASVAGGRGPYLASLSIERLTP